MPQHTEIRHFSYSSQQLYALVADVEKYPEFLPWCRAARILERHDDHFLAELVICFKHVCEQYTSKVSLHPPASEHEEAAIEVDLVSGPFDRLDNHWKFIPENGGTRVEFLLDFAFKSKWLDKLIGGMFTRASEKMVGAFSERAGTLYGNQA